MKRLSKEQFELDRLMSRWLEADGHDMPMSIQALSLEVIERAVLKREAGETVFVPPESPVVIGKCGESLVEWDGRSNG